MKPLEMALLACVGLAGCALQEGWTKTDTTDQELKAALYACERDMLIADAGVAFFRRCMEAKGYRQQK